MRLGSTTKSEKKAHKRTGCPGPSRRKKIKSRGPRREINFNAPTPVFFDIVCARRVETVYLILFFHSFVIGVVARERQRNNLCCPFFFLCGVGRYFLFWKREENLENLENSKKNARDQAGLLTNEKNVFGASEPIEKGHFTQRAREREKRWKSAVFCALVKFYLVLQNETTN